MFFVIREWRVGIRIAMLVLTILQIATAGGAQSQPQDKTDDGIVFGQLTDDDGTPVVAAQVSLFCYDSEGIRWTSTAAVQSDESGAFRFDGLSRGRFMVAVEKRGFARVFRDAKLYSERQQQMDLVLKPPVSTAVVLTDSKGRPIAGANIREFGQQGVNGRSAARRPWFKTFGINDSQSDRSGRLELPPLPAGEICDVVIEHADFAPIELKNIKIAAGAVVAATMFPGVRMTIHIARKQKQDSVESVLVFLAHEPPDHPSSWFWFELPIGNDGTLNLTVENGLYRNLLLKHDNYFITPVVRASEFKSGQFAIQPGRNDQFWFEPRRKVIARGRVIDADSGQPVPDVNVFGEISNDVPAGSPNFERARWAPAGSVETDERGEYRIPLAAGAAQLTFAATGYTADRPIADFTVPAAGGLEIPDFKVRRLPRIGGIVQTADGKPVPKAVVRYRGKYLRGVKPTLTDNEGRFELEPAWIPLNEETQERVSVHPLVAFDLLRPLSARIDVRIDNPGPVVLKLEPHEPGWLLSAFTDELNDWERGKLTPKRANEFAEKSLHNQLAPELDGILWLNSDKPTTLAEFRGKYVLLDFWTTWCVPCHRDFPSVKLLHEVYKDNLVIIGVHDNSVPQDAVREHVAKIDLPFPIVVDHPDGRTVARYVAHGIEGYPSYVLIAPDGKVLLDDVTIPHPLLRLYKIEIVRQYLLGKQPGR